MQNKIRCLLFLMILVACTGCQTIGGTASGAASGFSRDVATNPIKEGWDSLERVDGWIQENLW